MHLLNAKVLLLVIFSVKFCESINNRREISGNSLYDANDFVVSLNLENFETVVRNSSNAWFLEFYASWCGHCQRFAPIWKQIANDTKGWRDVIQLGAVNCANQINTPLCRKFNVEYYPTLRVLHHLSTEDEIGIGIKQIHGATIAAYRQFLVDYVTMLSGRNNTPQWPRMGPIEEETASLLTPEDDRSDKVIAIVAEKENSFLGREVILDLSSEKNIIVHRVVAKNAALIHALNVYEFPALLLSTAEGFQQLENVTSTRESYVQALRSILLEIRNTSTNLTTVVTNNVTETAQNRTETAQNRTETAQNKTGTSCYNSHRKVYMSDLENAIWYAISSEITGTEVLVNDTRDSLDKFLNALLKYFPGRPTLMTFLQDLQRQLSVHTGAVDAAQFGKMVEESILSSNFTGKMREWVGCKGSESRYKGYPCSLWTLFHTLTVNSVIAWEKEGSNQTNPLEVLEAILGYVTDFFGCRHCSQHFQMMAAVDMDTFVETGTDSVVWLWRAHNKVNARLRGDITEDPFHPKVQFPTQITCPSCWRVIPEGLEWKLPQVLAFLNSFYSSTAISTEGLESDKKQRENGGKLLALLG